jgi:hypothetical protein
MARQITGYLRDTDNPGYAEKLDLLSVSIAHIIH